MPIPITGQVVQEWTDENNKVMNNLKLLAFALLVGLQASCTKDEVEPPVTQPPPPATGVLRCTNTSLHTVQRILLNDTNYGTLDPGEYRDYALAPGHWTLQFVGLSGGTGCIQSSFNIAAGQSIGRGCSY